MQNSSQPFTTFREQSGDKEGRATTKVLLKTEEIERHARDWIFDSQYRQHSSGTIDRRTEVMQQFLWFLRTHNLDQVSPRVIRQFLAYYSTGSPEEPRWGNFNHHACRRPASRGTVHTVYSRLRTFFRWCVAEELIEASPMRNLAPPENNRDQIAPFTPEEVQKILRAARQSRYSLRDEAIAVFLLDTGVRASEMCSIRFGQMDWQGRKVTVLGKGQKERTVYFGRHARRVLWNYLTAEARDPSKSTSTAAGMPLFISEVGVRSGEPFTRWGLRRMITRLGERAGITDKRCSPHTFRHTFAVEFLRAGGNVFTLKELLGHSSLHMTNRYVQFVQADLENQHRQFSPADRLQSDARSVGLSW